MLCSKRKPISHIPTCELQMGSISLPSRFDDITLLFVCQVHTCKIRWQLSQMANWSRRTASTFLLLLLLLLLLPSLPNSPVQSGKPQLQDDDSIPPNLKDCSDWLCADSCDVYINGWDYEVEWKWVEWGQKKKKKKKHGTWILNAIPTCIVVDEDCSTSDRSPTDFLG